MICRLCEKEFEDYQGRKRQRCGSCNTKIRRLRAKQAAVEFLGGKCKCCGYNGNPAAFEFHHISGTKEFNIGNVSNRAWAIIKKELSKCELLCSNCHRIKHCTRTEQKWIDEALKYQGTIFNNG